MSRASIVSSILIKSFNSIFNQIFHLLIYRRYYYWCPQHDKDVRVGILKETDFYKTRFHISERLLSFVWKIPGGKLWCWPWGRVQHDHLGGGWLQHIVTMSSGDDDVGHLLLDLFEPGAGVGRHDGGEAELIDDVGHLKQTNLSFSLRSIVFRLGHLCHVESITSILYFDQIFQ